MISYRIIIFHLNIRIISREAFVWRSDKTIEFCEAMSYDQIPSVFKGADQDIYDKDVLRN